MLENLRKQGSSVFIYAIFGILIAMFVINFRPGGGNQDEGCSGSDPTAISINGNEADIPSFRVAYGLFNGQGHGRTHAAFELLLRRELLAGEAEARGLRVSDDLIDNELKSGNLFFGGERKFESGLFVTHENGEKTWSYKGLKTWVQQTFNLNMTTFRDIQIRELQASLMADILSGDVRVSRDEALRTWLYDHDTVTFDTVTFRPDHYRAALHITDEDAQRYLAAHEAEVRTRFTADAANNDVGHELRVREVRIDVADAGAAAGSAAAGSAAAGSAAAGSAAAGSAVVGSADGSAGSAAGSGSAAVVAGGSGSAGSAAAPTPARVLSPALLAAKAKLEAARAEVVAGKKKLADVAKELSTDESVKWNGGELGWRKVESLALGDKAVNDAVNDAVTKAGKDFKPGLLTPVIATENGVFLVQVEDSRSGKLDFDARKLEIAAKLAKDAWAREAAHRAAIAAYAETRAGNGKSLDQLFEREETEPQLDPQLMQLLQDPSVPDEQKQQLLQQYLQSHPRHGDIHVEGKDQPVAWYADSDGPSGSPGSATPMPAGSATTPTPTPTAGSATPAAGSAGSAMPAAGSAGSAGSAVAAAGSAATAAGSGAGSADILVPTTDKLPELGKVEPPKVVQVGPAKRDTSLPVLGTQKAAIDSLFDELAPGNLGKTIYIADGNYVVVQLTARESPKMADFDQQAGALMRTLLATRRAAAVDDWLRARCDEAARNKRISWSHALTRDTNAEGKEIADDYVPCVSFHHAAAAGGMDLGGGGGGGGDDGGGGGGGE